MKSRLSLFLALMAGTAMMAQEAKPDPKPEAPPKAVVRPAPPPVVRLAAPKEGDPKLTHPNGLVGTFTYEEKTYSVVFDGQKKEGELDLLKIQEKGKKAIEIPLRMLNKNYCMPKDSGKAIMISETLRAMNVSCQKNKETWEVRFFGLLLSSFKQCDADGTLVDLCISDMNRSGVLGEPFKFKKDADGFVTLKDMESGDMALVDGKQVPLGIPLIINGKAWAVKLDADGKPMLEKMDVKIGKVSLPKGSNLLLRGKEDLAFSEKIPENGEVDAIVGDYRVAMMAYELKGWQIQVGDMNWKGIPVTVEPGKMTALPLIEKVAVEVTASPLSKDRDLQLGLKISTPEGNPISMSPADRKIKPQFRVLDVAGKEVYTGNFEYG